MNDRFLKACRREEVDVTPVWFMRQAGRYLPEYRKIREKNDIMTICKTPELSTQVTLLPLQEFDVDAAILFADIMLPLEAVGVDLEFVENVGPVIQKPVQGMRDVDTLRMIEPGEDLPFVLDAIRMIRRELEGKLPLIGFSGAPFTLASYLIEGGPSRVFIKTKSMMYQEPHLWHSLMEKLTEIVRRYMKSQISAGVQALQLFDSWVGCLSPEDYREYVLPYSRSILQGLREMEIPIIHFGTGTATLLKLMKEAGGDVIGVDWRIPLDDAW
ncbi:uroporphyrinogen decarboxylase, partial [candidate division TA06 bacterium]|nr:uroporphyrinogen decarboxylase [candidate division TA06 bacterium]